MRVKRGRRAESSRRSTRNEIFVLEDKICLSEKKEIFPENEKNFSMSIGIALTRFKDKMDMIGLMR